MSYYYLDVKYSSAHLKHYSNILLFLYQDERFPGGIGLEGNITLTCVLAPCWFYN